MSLPVTNECTTTAPPCKLTGDFEILRHLPVFAGANTEVIKLFAYLAKRRKYQVDDYIIKYGKEADFSVLLISGEVEVTTVHRGKEIVLQHLPPDSFFGELALLGHFNWYFNVRVTKDADVIIIDRKSFKKVLSQFPDRREKIIEKIIQLRVSRLKQQTSNMLDQLLDAQSGNSCSTTMPL